MNWRRMCGDVFKTSIRAGGCVVFERRIFRGQAKGVPTHGMEHVIALHPHVARERVSDGVVAHMAHVQLTGWDRAAFRAHSTWACCWRRAPLRRARDRRPAGLPASLDLCRVVADLGCSFCGVRFCGARRTRPCGGVSCWAMDRFDCIARKARRGASSTCLEAFRNSLKKYAQLALGMRKADLSLHFASLRSRSQPDLCRDFS